MDNDAAGNAKRIWGRSVSTINPPISAPSAPPAPTATPPGGYQKGSVLADWLSSTDHKIIGHLYLITSFFFFMVAGLMALIMRAQLFGPPGE